MRRAVRSARTEESDSLSRSRVDLGTSCLGYTSSLVVLSPKTRQTINLKVKGILGGRPRELVTFIEPKKPPGKSTRVARITRVYTEKRVEAVVRPGCASQPQLCRKSLVVTRCTQTPERQTPVRGRGEVRRHRKRSVDIQLPKVVYCPRRKLSSWGHLSPPISPAE